MDSFQITIFGIAIIAAYSLAIAAVTFAFSRLLKRFRWKWWLLAPPALLLMAMPWAEEVWIALHFRSACKGAGIKVSRQVEVDGFYDSTMHSGYELIRDRKFKFMEHPSSEAGKIDHIEFANGQWKKVTLEYPKARYVLKYAYQPTPHRYEEPIGWKLEKLQYEVVDLQTGEILGSDTRITRYPNSMEMLWLQFFGPANLGCSAPLEEPNKKMRSGRINDYVLIPVLSQ